MKNPMQALSDLGTNISVTAAPAQFSDLLRRVTEDGETVTIWQDRRPVAMLVGVERHSPSAKELRKRLRKATRELTQSGLDSPPDLPKMIERFGRAGGTVVASGADQGKEAES